MAGITVVVPDLTPEELAGVSILKHLADIAGTRGAHDEAGTYREAARKLEAEARTRAQEKRNNQT